MFLDLYVKWDTPVSMNKVNFVQRTFDRDCTWIFSDDIIFIFRTVINKDIIQLNSCIGVYLLKQEKPNEWFHLEDL